MYCIKVFYSSPSSSHFSFVLKNGRFVVKSVTHFSLMTFNFGFFSFIRPLTMFTLNAPIATKFVCFSRLLKCLGSIYVKQCGPRSDCSYRSSLFWVHAVSSYTLLVSNVRQLFAADDFSRRHFQMHFFLGAVSLVLDHFCYYVSRLSLLYLYCLVRSLQPCGHLLGKG